MEREPIAQFEIRATTADDIVVLRHMHAKSWLATYPNDNAGISYDWVKEETDSWLTEKGLAKSREHFKNIFDSPEHLHQIAVDDEGKVIGLVHVLNQDGHKHLGALYVDEAYHGMGLAQQLMERANQWIGDEAVDLEVVTYNKRAIRFYEKQGFEKVEGENELFKGRIPNSTMARSAK